MLVSLRILQQLSANAINEGQSTSMRFLWECYAGNTGNSGHGIYNTLSKIIWIFSLAAVCVLCCR